MMKYIFPYLQLMRPANIVTSITNVASGFVASYSFLENIYGLNYSNFLYLLLASIGLYGGGIVFNDFFDSSIDAIERPYRPIPSGAVQKSHAGILGSFLFFVALLAALKVSLIGFFIALIICILCFLYNTITKHTESFGGITLALCRGLNLLLGTTSIPSGTFYLWPLAFIPFGLTIAIKLNSQTEVQGGEKLKLIRSILFYILTIFTFLIVLKAYDKKFESSFFFLGLYIGINFFYFKNAFDNPIPFNIQKLVKWGVLSFIIMDAASVASFSNFYYGLLVLSLLPISLFLSKFFTVT
uniref:hypothetical protein n=1 Tax=Neustupella aerophytica TaxID=2962111 RepID=UPI0021825820|nr:hypothetical protein N4K71_pgp083 [Neustupella aerophytica]UVI61116.1 hypothetical protein [Neustupella aerophytica]